MTRLYTEPQLDFCDVLFQPKRTTLNSRSEASARRVYTFKYYPEKVLSCGLIASNMATTGTFEMAKALEPYEAMTCFHKHIPYEELNKHFYTYEQLQFVSVGLKDDKEKFFKLLESNSAIDKVCVDIANGYIPNLLEFVSELRIKYPRLLIMAGNVVTGDMVQDLILSGADIVKVGIGNGSVCTTRLKTGVGRPQLSTILDCADAAHGVGGMICADGGCTCPGDVAKAFGAGADFVMLGGMLAGTDEAAGQLVTKTYQTNEIVHDTWVDTDGEVYSTDEKTPDCSLDHYVDTHFKIVEKKFKQFYGMSSKLAQDKHFGGMKCYRTSEGREKLIPYKGPVKDIIEDILGGIRSTMTYIGAKKLKDIPKCATFYTVNRQLNQVFQNCEDIQ